MLVGKWILASLPNIEVVSLFTIVYTVFFGSTAFFAVIVFIIVEGIIYGIGWWFYGYLLAWPILFLIAYILRKRANRVNMSVASALFGLSFGMLCGIPYGIMFGLKAAVAWWIAGIPYDILHGVGNFIICLFLYDPLIRALNVVKKTRP